jgi:shikimate kinase
MKNIVLVGLMGAGKTTVGKILSEKLKREFIDTDEMIVKSEKKSINEIFAQNGEKYFRELEKNIVLKVSQMVDKIISVGGGALENSENVSNLKHNGILFYLKADVDTLEKRLKNATDRPLLKNTMLKEKLTELLNKREKNYLLSQEIINTSNSKSTDIISEEIIEYYGKYN